MEEKAKSFRYQKLTKTVSKRSTKIFFIAYIILYILSKGKHNLLLDFCATALVLSLIALSIANIRERFSSKSK